MTVHNNEFYGNPVKIDNNYVCGSNYQLDDISILDNLFMESNLLLNQQFDPDGYLRNVNVGPTVSTLRHYSDDMTQPILLHHMKDLAKKITGQKSLKDTDNVDYYFYQANKEYLFRVRPHRSSNLKKKEIFFHFDKNNKFFYNFFINFFRMAYL